MARLWSIYWGYFYLYFRKELEYTTNFWVESLSFIIWIAGEVSLICFVLLPIRALQGWTLPHILLMAGISLAGVGLFFTVGVNLFYLPTKYILEGHLDRILLRPLDPYFQLLMDRISAHDAVTMVCGLGLTAYALHALGVGFSATTIALMVLMTLAAALIYLGLLTVGVTTAFWLKGRANPFHVIISTTDQLSSYPLGIYPPLMRTLMTVLVPIAFIGFYPSQAFDPVSEVRWLGLISPVVGVLTFFAGYVVFRIGMRTYESTGS